MKKLVRVSVLTIIALILFSFVFFGLPSRSFAQALKPEEIMYLIDLVLKSDGDKVPVPANVSQDELVMKMMTMFEESRKGAPSGVIEMIAEPTVESKPALPADEPIDCFIPNGQAYRMSTCAGNGAPAEFSLKVDWQPRIMTHIAGIGANGYFLEVRVQITNMTDKTWNGFRGTSFSVIEDFSESDVRMTYHLDDVVTSKKSKSYELNQLKEPVFPGQTVTYFLVFDISKHAVTQQTLVFRAVDYSDQKSETKIYLPLPDFIPVQYN